MILLFLWGCGAECSDGPTYETWAQGFFVSKCQPCHAPDARDVFDAPAIELSTHEDILNQLHLIQDSVLNNQRMPPGGGLSDDERELLQQWVDCPQ